MGALTFGGVLISLWLTRTGRIPVIGYSIRTEIFFSATARNSVVSFIGRSFQYASIYHSLTAYRFLGCFLSEFI